MQKPTYSLMAGLFGQRSPPTGQDGLFCIYLLLMFQWLPYAVAQSNRPTLTIYADFSISGIIALILVFGACFFLFFITICLYRYSRIETSRTIGLNDVQGRISRTVVTQGLEPAFIQTLPVFPYSHVKDHKLGNGALECAVCLREFEDEDKLRLLPKCDHVFHPECIDVWLANHVTCPVCRANLLVPATSDNPAAIVPVQDIEGNLDTENPTLEPVDQENKQVSPAPEVITQTQMQNRQGRLTKLRCEGRYPRSHSTGHSLVQPGENLKRFTLRLPKEMRDQMMNTSHLNRTRSMMVLPMQMSSRKGYLMTGEGSSREGKSMVEKPEGSVFSMTPPFFVRAFSRRSQKIVAVGGDAPVTPRRKVLMSSLRLCRKADETVPSISSSLV